MAGYSEDELIEQPAIELFGELKWKTADCFHEFESFLPSGEFVGTPEEAFDCAAQVYLQD